MREIHQRYTGVGWTGIFCMLAGAGLIAWESSIISGYFIAVSSGQSLYSAAPNRFDSILLLLGCFLSLVSGPMILVGRAYEIWEDPRQ